MPLARLADADCAAAAWSSASGSRCSTRSSTAASRICPATYIWARTKRMSKTRDAGGHEVMGWLEGGYQTLIDALAAKIRELGGEIHASTAGRRDPRDGRRRDRARRRRPLPAVRPRALHARAAGCAPAHAGLRCAASAARSVPLPRRRLPAPPDRAQRQPVLPPQHHRPARSRSPRSSRRRTSSIRSTSAAHCSTSRSTSIPAIPTSSDPDEIERDYLGHARTMLPDLARRGSCSARSCSGRGSSSPCISSAARSGCRRCSLFRGSRLRRRRTSTRRS